MMDFNTADMFKRGHIFLIQQMFKLKTGKRETLMFCSEIKVGKFMIYRTMEQ